MHMVRQVITKIKTALFGEPFICPIDGRRYRTKRVRTVRTKQGRYRWAIHTRCCAGPDQPHAYISGRVWEPIVEVER